MSDSESVGPGLIPGGCILNFFSIRYFHITHNPLCLGGQERQTSNKYGVCCVLVVVYFVMGLLLCCLLF